MVTSRPGGYCAECGYEVESFEGLECCPGCGSQSMPFSWKDEVQITLNWHQLRCLCMWAESWARDAEEEKSRRVMNHVIARIVDKIEKAHPSPLRAPLTLVKELALLAEEYDVVVQDPRLRQDIAEQTGKEVLLYLPKQ